tara:strand:- start:213 stop:536 length:324 start_codon:yes stop_codon:yes gene_type:complete
MFAYIGPGVGYGSSLLLFFVFFVLPLVIFFFLARILANLSEGRNISRKTAFWVCFILGPIIGLIVIFASGKESIPSTNQKTLKTCPDCAEDVNDAALKCKHCGYRWT